MCAIEGASTSAPHVPVLYNEILNALRPTPGDRYIDGTLGAGGHAEGILRACSPDGKLLGLDRDPEALRIAAERLQPFGHRVHLANASFAEMAEVASSLGWGPASVGGIVLDLGLSSMQLADPGRGFSFLSDGPLDMRFDPRTPETAADLVNRLPPDALAELLRRYGEEPQARKIAGAIVAARPIRTSRELAEAVAGAVGGRKRGPAGKIHPATRTFQALRIVVNDELAAVEAVLPDAVRLLRPGGRLAVISFHSLEDRIVKDFIRRETRDCICPPEQPVCTCGHKASLVEPLGRKPTVPSDKEITRNPRARSAKLRVAEKLKGDR